MTAEIFGFEAMGLSLLASAAAAAAEVVEALEVSLMNLTPVMLVLISGVGKMILIEVVLGLSLTQRMLGLISMWVILVLIPT